MAPGLAEALGTVLAAGAGAALRELAARIQARRRPVPVAIVARIEPPQRRPRVLVVDDEPSYAKLTARRIGMAHDVDVDIAHDAEEALALARTRAYVVVVADLKLPSMSGRDLLAKLRPRTIIYSGADDDALEALRREGAADRVVAKDLDVAPLLDAVRELL